MTGTGLYRGSAAGRAAVLGVAVSGVLILFTGPLGYHLVAGDATEAIVTDIQREEARSARYSYSGVSFRLAERATGDDLGRMDFGPHERPARGDTVNVRVDPLALSAPVAEDRVHSVGAFLPATATALTLAGLLCGIATMAVRESRTWRPRP